MSGMAEPLTEDERQTLKAAAFGAVHLVSNADPGVFDTIRESFAATSALAGASGLVREVLTGGPVPRLPRTPEADSAGGGGGGQADLAAFVLPALRRSVAILAAKAPQELASYRATVVEAVHLAAGAADGVSTRESEMIAKVKQALAG
jgi:hypothetical protein